MQAIFLGELIERAAKECGSKQELAKRLGVTPQKLSNWRTGAVQMPPEQAAIIADIAGLIPEDWLVRVTLWNAKEKPYRGNLEKALGKLSRLTEGGAAGFFAIASQHLSRGDFDFLQCVRCKPFIPFYRMA
jgi:transcriptional regulator with XRE-family HTH domain